MADGGHNETPDSDTADGGCDETPDPDTADGGCDETADPGLELDDQLDLESGLGQSDWSQLKPTQALTPRPSKGTSSKQLERYCLKYEDNNSKRWDGREILVDKSYLESLYDTDELQPGMLVTLPWTGKGG